MRNLNESRTNIVDKNIVDKDSFFQLDTEKFLKVYKHEDFGIVITDTKFNIIKMNPEAQFILLENSENTLENTSNFLQLFSHSSQKKIKKKVKSHKSEEYSDKELLRFNTYPMDTVCLEVYFQNIFTDSEVSHYRFVVMEDRNFYFKQESEKREEYYKSILNLVEEERVHLGNELHDNLAQDLYAIRILLQSFILKNGFVDEIMPAKKILSNAISNLTRYSNDSIPYLLKESAFTHSVSEVVKKHKENGFDFSCEVDPALNNQSTHVLFTLYNLLRLFYYDCKKIDKKSGIHFELSSHSNVIRFVISEKRSEHDDSFETLYSMTSLENIKSILTLYNGTFEFVKNKVNNRFLITLYVQ